MQYILLITFSLFIIGCSDKSNVPHPNNTSDSSSFGDTVSIDQNSYASRNSLDGSSNGFKSVYFSFGEYTLPSSMNEIMSMNIKKAKETNHKIKISGNCDEFGTDEYNYALGLKRAKYIDDLFSSYGITNTIIITLGESNPLCSSPSDECYSRNRRVDFKLIQD